MNDLGCIGYLKDGIIKSGYIILVKTEDDTPSELFKKYKEIYGDNMIYCYVICKDVNKKFELLQNKMKINRETGNIYNGFSSGTNDILQEVTGEKNICKFNVSFLNKIDEKQNTDGLDNLCDYNEIKGIKGIKGIKEIKEIKEIHIIL
jgi:hypothetical protein